MTIEEFYKLPPAERPVTGRLSVKPTQHEYRKWSLKLYAQKGWKKLSKQVRNEYPTCQICENVLSQVTHHIKDIYIHNDRECCFDLNLFWDRDNLQAVCKACHSNVHRDSGCTKQKYCSHCGQEPVEGVCFCNETKH